MRSEWLSPVVSAAAPRRFRMRDQYRLAPDHPDPAPVEDCYAGLVWTAKNAAELGIDPERLVITGISGDGGLAAGPHCSPATAPSPRSATRS